ncbi:unnamed protein product, partial [Linum tenue]
LSQGLGSKQNRTYCPFYFKIIAFRHTKSSVSPTILLSNMYQRPNIINHGVGAQGNLIDPRKIQQHFEVLFLLPSLYPFPVISS